MVLQCKGGVSERKMNLFGTAGGGMAGALPPQPPTPHTPPLTFLSKILCELLHLQEIVSIHGGAGGGQRAQHVRLQHREGAGS